MAKRKKDCCVFIDISCSFQDFYQKFYQTFIYLRFVTIENFMRFWPLQGDLSDFLLSHLVPTKCHLIHHLPVNSFEMSFTLKILWITFNLLSSISWNKVRSIQVNFLQKGLRNDNLSLLLRALKILSIRIEHFQWFPTLS